MTELEPQADTEPSTVVLTHSGRQTRVHLSPEIGGIGKAIQAWKECGGQHTLFFGENRVSKKLGFSDWLIAQSGVAVAPQVELNNL